LPGIVCYRKEYNHELLDFLDVGTIRYPGDSYWTFTVEKKSGNPGCKKTSALDITHYNSGYTRKPFIEFFLVLSK
jgi:hypothetical protein